VVQTKLRFAGLGLSRAPAIEARTLGKMNLKVRVRKTDNKNNTVIGTLLIAPG
jgi:hypothetical protein